MKGTESLFGWVDYISCPSDCSILNSCPSISGIKFLSPKVYGLKSLFLLNKFDCLTIRQICGQLSRFTILKCLEHVPYGQNIQVLIFANKENIFGKFAQLHCIKMS